MTQNLTNLKIFHNRSNKKIPEKSNIFIVKRIYSILQLLLIEKCKIRTTDIRSKYRGKVVHLKV